MKGVQNISQITKAMELVAANKMRKSQEIALASRPYTFTALDLLAKLSKMPTKHTPALLQNREVKHTLYVVITSDKGLAGPFNNEILRTFEKFVKKHGIRLASPEHLFVAVGQKAHDYLQKQVTLQKTFTRIGDYSTLEEVRPIASFITEGFIQNKWDRVLIFSTQFESALSQKVMVREIFPVTFENLKSTAEEMTPKTGRLHDMIKNKEMNFFDGDAEEADYLIEPSPEEALAILIPYLIEMQIYHLILETNASEHAARRTAMKNASDNAEELGDELNLSYNKSRQASITKELLEISAGVESLQ